MVFEIKKNFLYGTVRFRNVFFKTSNNYLMDKIDLFSRNKLFKVSFATSISKLIGFARQIFIAAAFGLEITYDAFNYATIIPGFLLIIIGGINGPLYNTIVATLTDLDQKKAGLILTRVSIKITIFLLILGIIVFLNSNLIN